MRPRRMARTLPPDPRTVSAKVRIPLITSGNIPCVAPHAFGRSFSCQTNARSVVPLIPRRRMCGSVIGKSLPSDRSGISLLDVGFYLAYIRDQVRKKIHGYMRDDLDNFRISIARPPQAPQFIVGDSPTRLQQQIGKPDCNGRSRFFAGTRSCTGDFVPSQSDLFSVSDTRSDTVFALIFLRYGKCNSRACG